VICWKQICMWRFRYACYALKNKWLDLLIYCFYSWELGVGFWIYFRTKPISSEMRITYWVVRVISVEHWLSMCRLRLFCKILNEIEPRASEITSYTSSKVDWIVQGAQTHLSQRTFCIFQRAMNETPSIHSQPHQKVLDSSLCAVQPFEMENMCKKCEGLDVLDLLRAKTHRIRDVLLFETYVLVVHERRQCLHLLKICSYCNQMV
jgi:hypothetical protein